jgi:uncharacterized protein YfiM (DUF2279 family)
MANEQDALPGGEQDAGSEGKNDTDNSQGGQEQAGEFKGNSLMTKEEGGNGDQKADKAADKGQGKEGDKSADDPASKVPDKPDGYALKFAEGTYVDTEMLTEFQKVAHELGISQDKAQKLASFYETHAEKAGGRAVAEHQKVIDAAKAQWEAEIEKSPTFTKDRENIRSALRQYGDQELYDLLDQTNLGSHPKMWAFMANVGKALAEPGFHGKNSGKERTAAEVLYPNQGK